MSITGNRRERERAQRHRPILAVARELAEAEGWEAAITTRRLATCVEVKDAIVTAVAEEGFAELAKLLRAMRGPTPEGASPTAAYGL
ncbi:hypothetical protein ABIA32_003835 [Streptacidiphilus sp. MAP12-20]|uniref:hypothetical protein n=1 Tax=Streptacidiphilus sp. MAP12-20 TaxID=3156299 RepID=UPI003512ABA1